MSRHVRERDGNDVILSPHCQTTLATTLQGATVKYNTGWCARTKGTTPQ